MAKAAPFWDPSAIFDIPEPGTMPRSQFDQVVQKKMKEMKMAMPPTPQPVEPPGMRLGQAMRQAFTPSQAPIDAGIKAGLMPEQVTAVNQQLLAERQLEQQNAIAQEEMGIKREYANVQRQQAAMGLEEQRMKLAAMFMPKPYEPKLEVLGDRVVDMNDPRNIGITVPEEGMDAYQREQVRLREQELGLRRDDMQARLGLQRQSLALRARGGGGGGTGADGKPIFRDDGAYAPVRDPSHPSGWRMVKVPGYDPAPEAPEAPAQSDINSAYELYNSERFVPALQNIVRAVDPVALEGLAAQFGGPKNIPEANLKALAAQLAPEATAREEAIRRSNIKSAYPEAVLPDDLTAKLGVAPDGSVIDGSRVDEEDLPEEGVPPAPTPALAPAPSSGVPLGTALAGALGVPAPAPAVDPLLASPVFNPPAYTPPPLNFGTPPKPKTARELALERQAAQSAAFNAAARNTWNSLTATGDRPQTAATPTAEAWRYLYGNR